MKKFLIAGFAVFSFVELCYGKSFSVSNTIGADSDSITSSDFYYFTKNKNPDESVSESSGFSLGDRFQAEYSDKKFSARGRIEIEYNRNDDSDESFFLNPSGYVYFSPVTQAGFFFGNDAFKKFVIPSSFLAASDDYTKYGRMITDSVSTDSEYNEVSRNFYVPEQILTGAFTSNWFFGKKDRTYLKFSAVTSLCTDSSEDELYSVDSGINFGINKIFDTGITLRNITGGTNMKAGAFAGLKSVENLILNGSFYYNFTSDDYLPETAVTRTDDYTDEEYYEYKKQKTLFALGLSCGYKFKKAGTGIYADFISGLNSKYVADVKYYLNGELQDSEWKIVDRGDVVKYKVKKSGSSTKTSTAEDGFTENAVPFFFNFRADYELRESVKAELDFKLRSMFRDSGSTWITVYPKFTFKLPGKAGEISSGVRLDMNGARTDGISGVSVPVTYTYKFSKKF